MNKRVQQRKKWKQYLRINTTVVPLTMRENTVVIAFARNARLPFGVKLDALLRYTPSTVLRPARGRIGFHNGSPLGP